MCFPRLSLCITVFTEIVYNRSMNRDNKLHSICRALTGPSSIVTAAHKQFEAAQSVPRSCDKRSWVQDVSQASDVEIQRDLHIQRGKRHSLVPHGRAGSSVAGIDAAVPKCACPVVLVQREGRGATCM